MGRPIASWDPHDLEIHQARDALVPKAPTAMSASEEYGRATMLTAYIRRSHDDDLAGVVKAAADGRSRLAVLVGSTSTGKTRACWEAVQSLTSHGWRLWHPVEQLRPEALLDGLDRVGPRTVLWLNEIQLYLSPATGGIGERAAAALGGLLRDQERGPVLMLGTIWREDWQALCAPAVPERPDPHTEARRLLTGRSIDVPDDFTGVMDALRTAADTDPLLRQALSYAEGGRITQYVAGVPILMERYHTSPAPAKALIHAAIGLQALGLGPALPKRLLAATAPAYLTQTQWEDSSENVSEDWPDKFLDLVCRPRLGVPGPLTAVRPRPGQAPLTEPCYRLADPLWQSAVTLRAPGPADSTEFSRALLTHASNAEIVIMAHTSSAQADYYMALHREGRRSEDATAWLRARAGASCSLESITFAAELRKAGSAWEALCWQQRLSEISGNRDSLRDLFSTARCEGRLDQVLRWVEDAIASGDPKACEYAELGALQLFHEGRLDEAAMWYGRA